MAIINSYPKGTPKAEDLLIGTEVPQEYSGKKGVTKNFKITDIANLVISETSGITGSGTLNTIAMFTPNGKKIGDSLITQAALGQAISVNTNLLVSDDLNVTGSIEAFSSLSVNGNTTFLSTITAGGGTGTAGQVLSSTGTGVEWVDNTSTGTVTGTGTTNILPIWTDGPNGEIGDSIITQEIFAPGTGSEESRIKISNPNPGPGSNGNFLIVNTGRFNRIETDRIVASDSGAVTMNGDVNIGNSSTDELNIISTTNIWNVPVKSGPTLFGGLAPGADHVLASTASSTLNWTSQDDYVSGAITKLIPFTITASAGGSDDYDRPNNIVEIGWTGGNGTYVLNIPSAATIPYRNIRFVTNSTFPNGASDKVQITAQSGETIDGAAFFEISKQYEGVSLWSNGTEWIVIQAKAH